MESPDQDSAGGWYWKWVLWLHCPPFPLLSLSPTHLCSLVNSVIMPYFKYLVIKCHCNSPRELFDISLISFLTLNMLLCVLPLYLFGLCKVSGVQHRTQELIGKQNTDMACDWRGDLFSFVPAAVNLLHCQNSHFWLCCCTVIMSDKRHKEELSGVVHLPISISERCEGLQPNSVNNLKSSFRWRDWQWQEEGWTRRNRDWRDAFMRWKEQKMKRIWSDLTHFRPFSCKSSINLWSVASLQDAGTVQVWKVTPVAQCFRRSITNHKTNRRIYCQRLSSPASECNTCLTLRVMQLCQQLHLGDVNLKDMPACHLRDGRAFLCAWKCQASILIKLSDGWLRLDIVGRAGGYMGKEKMLFAFCPKVFQLCCWALGLSVWHRAADAQEVSRVYIKLCWVCRTFWLLSSLEAAI